jgi:hypothetical protein
VAGLSGITGNTQLQQLLLWNVASQLIGAALTPYTVALANELNQITPIVPLSPADAAEAVLRGAMTEADAAKEASFGGINGDRFAVLAQLAGNAPDPASLAVALRRKLIDQTRYTQGIRQGRLRDEWAELVQELAVQQPSPQAMLDAYLEGQIPESEARDRFAQLGGDPAYFDILFHTQGQAPTPTQALEMANRKVIPWDGQGPDAVSFEQAFLEGPWRNKWASPFRALGEYLPPPRTVTAMHKEGSLSTAEATALLEKQGLTPQLAAAYLASSSAQKVATTKELAQGTVLTLYRDRIIPRAIAAEFLSKLRYSTAEADYILQVEDLRMAERFMTAAVGRVHTLYVSHKIDQLAAAEALAILGLEAAQVTELVALWGHERAANVRTLTPAQVEAAFGFGILDQPTAQAELVAMGYTPHDAWTALSVHHKAALPDEPGAGALTPPAGP